MTILLEYNIIGNQTNNITICSINKGQNQVEFS